MGDSFSDHSKPARLIRLSRPVSLAITVVLILWAYFSRTLLFSGQILPIAYAIPIVLCLWMRDRFCIWLMASAFSCFALIEFIWVQPNETMQNLTERLFYASMVIVDTVVVAIVVTVVLAKEDEMERQNFLLFEKNNQLKRHQGDLDQSERRFRTIFDMMPFGVSVSNLDMTRIQHNAAAAKILDVPVEISAGIDEWPVLWTLMNDDGTPMPVEEYPLVKALRQGVVVPPREITIHLSTGRETVLYISAAPFRDQSGKIVGGVVVYADVTQMHNLREQLEQRRKDAEENVVRKARFLAAVSHDIRNPANAINLLAELIHRAARQPEEFAEIPEMAMELKNSATALVNLVGDVLDMARFDSGKVENRPVPFVMQDLIYELFSSLEVTAREKKLSLVRAEPSEPLHLMADRQKLARIINNLVGNAIKFTETGSVQLAYHVLETGEFQLVVADTGIGISPEHLRDIFDEFFQIRNPERDRSKGAGLGLSICKRLVAAMKGKIDVQSTPGQGTTFTVTLPAECVRALVKA